MQNTTSRPAPASGGQAQAARKSGAKKKKPQPKISANGKDTAAPSPAPAGPRPVAPPPVSGPWGNPRPAAGSAPPPGFAPSPPKPTAAGFSDAHQRLLRHRALFAFRFLVGKAVELRLAASEERYAGVLDCVDPDDFSVVLKNAKRLSSAADAKPFEDGSTVIFRRQQLAHLVADGAVNYTDGVLASAGAAAAGGFRTDTEISGQKGEHLFGRELEAASSWLDPALDTGALEDAAPNGRRKNQGKAGWNQFEANEKLFGVVSSYDENIYTTKLDKSKISTEQSRAAERLAQEIERQSAAGNFHLQEERGQTVRGGKHANDLDEEARYSSVDRRGAPASSSDNAYVPPALRNAQRQSSGGKSLAKATKAAPASAAAAPVTPAPAPAAAEVEPASEAVPPPPKPLSFSEAVTGRSAAAVPKAPASKAQVDEKKGASSSPQKAPTPASVNGKDSKAATKSKGASPKKKDAVKEKKTESKTEESKTESKSSSSSSTTTTTTTTTKQSKEEAPKAAPKKGLNPNAKEFKLSAAAAEFTPSFAMPPAVKEHVSSPYRGGSPGHMPYPHPGMGYPPPMQEEWMYDGGMGGEEGGEMGVPPYMQGGYPVPMGPNGVPMMYPPMMPQQNMRMMGGQRGGYGGYQQGYNPRGYYSPPNGGYPGAGMPYAGGPGMPGGVGPQPPLPREPTPSGDESTEESAPDSAPAPPVPETAPAVESAPSKAKQQTPASKKK